MFKQAKAIKNKAAIIIAGLIIAILLWFIQPSSIKRFKESSKVEQSDQIDYYITNFTTHVFQKNGTLNYILKGEQLNHYKNNNQTIIEHPTLTYADTETWTIVGDQAITTEAWDETITFKENASMQNDGEETLLIKADSLSFSPNKKNFIADSHDTENSVYISWKNGTIKGSKIIANLLDETFTLQNAQATYKNTP